MLLKIVLTPALITIATLVARRAGPEKGGLIAGLPLVSGPLSVFLSLEQGPLFASRSAQAGLLGLVAVAVFCVVYIRVAGRGGPLVAAASGIASCLVAIRLLAPLQLGLALCVLLAMSFIFLAYLAAGNPAPEKSYGKILRWDLPLRMASATMVVLHHHWICPRTGRDLERPSLPLPGLRFRHGRLLARAGRCVRRPSSAPRMPCRLLLLRRLSLRGCSHASRTRSPAHLLSGGVPRRPLEPALCGLASEEPDIG